ncbi:MAG TPA: helix-turn-helix domain-containing protein [Rubricoccaceae bacterium]|jgi:AraC-like DNA-binding protein
MPDLLPRFLALVDAHRSDPNTSVETLAEALSMTSRHLRRLLVARCGETPGTLLRRRRVEHAERLIAAGATLRAAARAAGYMDLSAFNRAFRAVTGRPPAAVRPSRDETADRPMQRESASHPTGVGSAHVR